ncbi:hypothetical protein VHEMI03060 [[Torrubiella] hemipterigena]|nr:hypothetical protein VHEMI03060 [[Torrubiella] hemipterigena]
MTLIGADVERICDMWKFIITDTWASILQLGIGIWLLQRQLGAVCIAPVIFAVLSTAISLRAGTYVGKRQKTWLEAVQKRVNFTSHALSNMKSIKMLGYSDGIHDFIQALRLGELDRAKHYRKLSSVNICLTNLPNTVAPLITFATYAIANKLQGQDDFTMSKAIASLAILQVIMYPLGSLLNSVPQCFSAVACFQRIQTFLNEKTIQDDRLFGTSTLEKTSEVSPAEPTDSIILHNATIGWSAPVVHDISFKVSRDSSLVAIVGPVACGKSTIINALVGEAHIFSGTVWMASKEVSVCQQSAWLSSGTIREQVIGDYGFSEAWYNEVIRACALHTDLELMSDGDQTDVGAQGVGLSGGQRQRIAIARAIYSRKPIAIFDDVLSALDATTQESIIENVFGPAGLMRKMGTTLVLATHSARCLSVMDRVITISSEGRITDNSISGSGSDTPKSIMNRSEPEPVGGVDASIVQTQIRSAQDAARADRSIGDLEVYKYYFSSLGVVGLSMFGLFVCAYAAFGSVQQAWLKLWAESDSSSNTGYWLGLYALWTLLRSSGLVIAVIFLWIIITPRSGTRLHQAVLTAAFKAPMSFHSQTDTGTLVNRFSQDMQLADIVLPVALITTSFQLSGCIGYGILTFVATPYFAAFVPFVVGLLALLQRFYLRTSKQIRLIELESKAPLYSHMIDTINGVVSIRAFGWFASYKDKYFSLLDDCQKPFYLLLCIQRWLAVMLGLIVAILATSLTAMAVGLRGTNVSAGFIGIALVNMMGLGEILASLIMFWTSLETSLGAVSRVKTFSEDTPAEPEPVCTAPAEWPRSGDIQVTNLTALHADFVALKDLTIDIKSGEKIAICGRTGSGKSSLITAMLGMMDIQSGSIVLDGQDLSQVTNEVVRKRITCITQDPYLFSASVRLNMDLHGISNDEDIQAALVRVGLWSVLRQSLGEGVSATKILDASMDDVHLSHGQRQLICLARTLLRKNKVVLLDEPTSSVDAATEAKMTEIIDSEFPGATILMITHRLTSIHSFDKVMVLDAGKLAEFGAPATLLADDASVFSQLYKSQAA